MSLSYTTGNPTNLTAGANASMNDIQGPFTDIKTFLTDGSAAVGDTILASPTSAVWRTVFAINFVVVSLSTTPSFFSTSPPQNSASGGTAGSVSGLWIPSTLGDVAVAGKTTKLRVRVSLGVNGVPPGITITWGLYPIATLGGSAAFTPTLGTVVPGSTAAVVTPGSGSGSAVVSSGFDLSALTVAALHVPGVVGSSGQAGNSEVAGQFTLEQRHT